MPRQQAVLSRLDPGPVEARQCKRKESEREARSGTASNVSPYCQARFGDMRFGMQKWWRAVRVHLGFLCSWRVSQAGFNWLNLSVDAPRDDAAGEKLAEGIVWVGCGCG